MDKETSRKGGNLKEKKKKKVEWVCFYPGHRYKECKEFSIFRKETLCKWNNLSLYHTSSMLLGNYGAPIISI